MPQFSIKIKNIKGLHARASAKLVEVVESHNANATISKDSMSASGDSIMGLLMLAAPYGSFIEVETSGPDADVLAEALRALVTEKFGEEA